MQRAKNIFFAAERRVAKGELFADDDPILKGRETLFEQVDVPVPVAPAKPAAKKTTPKAAATKPAG